MDRNAMKELEEFNNRQRGYLNEIGRLWQGTKKDLGNAYDFMAERPAIRAVSTYLAPVRNDFVAMGNDISDKYNTNIKPVVNDSLARLLAAIGRGK